MFVVNLFNGKYLAFMRAAFSRLPVRLRAAVCLALSHSFVHEMPSESADLPCVELRKGQALRSLTNIHLAFADYAIAFVGLGRVPVVGSLQVGRK